MSEWVSEAILAILTFVVGYVETKRNKEQRKTDKEAREFRERQEARAQLRAKEAELAMRMSFTTLKLANATACAVSGGKCNGNMTSALAEADKAEDEYQQFIVGVAAQQTTKI